MKKNYVSGYHPHKMAKFGTFPDSYKEAKIVEKKMKNPDWEYFTLTDTSPRVAFIQYLEENNLQYDPAELKYIIIDSLPTIMSLKNYYNRPRPKQMIPHLPVAQSETAKTPAYPSGHALQSYLIAHHLSQKYPSRKRDFFKIADRIADARVSVGLHYPSDNNFSKEIYKWMV